MKVRNQPFSTWMRESRTKRKMSLAELSKKTGISQVTLLALEEGRVKTASQKNAIAIAKAFTEEAPLTEGQKRLVHALEAGAQAIRRKWISGESKDGYIHAHRLSEMALRERTGKGSCDE
jgi:transcriptional regulator with XRE-family HTH domain